VRSIHSRTCQPLASAHRHRRAAAVRARFWSGEHQVVLAEAAPRAQAGQTAAPVRERPELQASRVRPAPAERAGCNLKRAPARSSTRQAITDRAARVCAKLSQATPRRAPGFARSSLGLNRATQSHKHASSVAQMVADSAGLLGLHAKPSARPAGCLKSWDRERRCHERGHQHATW
jgi:hypothetical protein